MTIERTLVLIKPDGVQRGLSGEIISRFEKTGLKIIAIKLMSISEDKASQHYAEHTGKPFYGGLVEFITSSPVVAMAFEGTDAISLVRKQMGSTNPNEATPGSIRGDYAADIGRNLVHGSAASEDAERELKLFFSSEELLSYDRSYENWVTE